MFLLLLDVATLWAITALLARQNMSDEIYRFVISALVLMGVSGIATFAGVEALIDCAVWFCLLFLGMCFFPGRYLRNT